MKSKTTLSNNKWVKYITIGGIGLAFIGASYSHKNLDTEATAAKRTCYQDPSRAKI